MHRQTYYEAVATSMSEATYFVLVSLANEPLHGYAVGQRAEELSDGQVRLTAGTLYGALDRLSAKGLLEVTGEESVAGRRRRYYALTEAGRGALTEEATRLARAAEVATQVGISVPATLRGNRTGGRR
jgi:DNA-binding PadR family transcriptional regulator